MAEPRRYAVSVWNSGRSNEEQWDMRAYDAKDARYQAQMECERRSVGYSKIFPPYKVTKVVPWKLRKKEK